VSSLFGSNPRPANPPPLFYINIVILSKSIHVIILPNHQCICSGVAYWTLGFGFMNRSNDVMLVFPEEKLASLHATTYSVV
jgi:hypothetical protein